MKNRTKLGVYALRVSILLFFIITLSACGSNSKKLKTETYKLENNGMTIVMTFKVDGDTVVEQSTNNKIPYSSLGAKTKEEAEKIIAPNLKKYEGVKGVSDTVEYGKDGLEETVSIKYKEVDFDKIASLPGMFFDNSNGKVKKVSMKQTAKMLEEAGAKKQ